MTLRRDFLGFTAGAIAARTVLPIAARAEGVTTVIPSPDADLIAACAEYLRISRKFEAYCVSVPGDIEPDDAGAHAILAPLDGLTGRIVAMSATTAEGHLARARCRAFGIKPGNRQCRDDPDATSYDRLEAAELRDLVRMERGAVHPSLSPDAALLEACADFDALERAYHTTAFNVLADTPEDLAAEAERDRIRSEQDAVVQRMCSVRAVTREGMAARARSLALWDGELMKAGPREVGELLTAAIVRDLLGSSHSRLTGQSSEAQS